MTENKDLLRKFFAVAAQSGDNTENPWTAVDKDLSETIDYEYFTEMIQLIRFFYRTEPIVSTVVNKLVEIGTNDLIISKNRMSDNEHRAFLFIKNDLLQFSAQMAQEYLLSGLVAPEVGFGKIDGKVLLANGIKKMSNLIVPKSMYVRDPVTIKIYPSIIADKPSYFVKIPENMVEFIKGKGEYSDGKKNEELFKLIQSYYPEFVAAVLKGETEVLLDTYVLRRKYMTDNPYPVPYISSVLDALQHKRKMRRMDYSLMDKIISAILHVKVGTDEFPVTESEEDETFISTLKAQLNFRRRTNADVEKLFQLLTSHVVNLEWIFPNSEILLNNAKYDDINLEILFGLGFPQSLITGESSRSGTSDVEMSLVSPIKTMESFRLEIIPILQNICYDMAEKNGMKNAPLVSFAPINLHKFSDFLAALTQLYSVSSLSRTSFAKYLGQDFAAEVDILEEEVQLLESKNLPMFGEAPFSRNPGDNRTSPDNTSTDPKETKTKTKTDTNTEKDK